MSEISTAAGPGKLTAGIDTGKHWLDVGLSDGRSLARRRNDAAGHEALAEELGRLGVQSAGIEATGGYEAEVCAQLRRRGIAVRVLQPRQVKAYALFRLKRAKSDKIDALIIARCCAELGEPGAPPDPRLASLASRLTLIDQIAEDIARAKVRLEFCADAHAVSRHKGEIKRLAAERRAEIAALDALLREHPDLAHKADLVESVSGVGRITALIMVIRMPELGEISREQAACLLGAAPFMRQSGAYEGQRRVAGGRARPRTALFACAQAAIRWNQDLAALYKRLMQKGRHHSAAVMACTRKLVVLINAVLARGTEWTQQTPPRKLLTAKP